MTLTVHQKTFRGQRSQPSDGKCWCLCAETYSEPRQVGTVEVTVQDGHPEADPEKRHSRKLPPPPQARVR